MLDESMDITPGSVLGAFGDLGVLRGGEIAIEAIQEALEDETLTVVQRKICNCFPQSCFRQHGLKGALCALNGAAQTIQEPIHP